MNYLELVIEIFVTLCCLFSVTVLIIDVIDTVKWIRSDRSLVLFLSIDDLVVTGNGLMAMFIFYIIIRYMLAGR